MKVSIKNKILCYFTILIFLSLFILIYFTNSMINKHNEYIIKKEIIDIKKHSDIYLAQLFLNKKKENIENITDKEKKEIVEEISFKVGYRTSIYSKDGEFLIDSVGAGKDENDNKDDLARAIEEETAYTINYNKNNVSVKFSYPINIENKKVGIIRYTIDYSDLFKWGIDFINITIVLSVILFIAILIISFIMAKGITKPIEKLTILTKRMADGDLNIHENIKSNDEIGELFTSFCIMAEKINDQINRIKRDKEEIKNLEIHRKKFFDNVTHELKTPLTTILGYAEVIEDNGFNNDEEFFKKGINHIIIESKRLRDMVIDLIEFSKVENKNIEDEAEIVDLSNILSNTCEEMMMKAKRYNIKIIQKIESDIYFMGIENKLKQVFINIIDNSIKYSCENKTIIVNAKKLGKTIMVTISDEGQGISEDKLKNIFEPFYRVNKSKCREQGSSGLGLSITKSIVEKHKGRIWVESNINVGTKVIIEFYKFET